MTMFRIPSVARLKKKAEIGLLLKKKVFIEGKYCYNHGPTVTGVQSK